MFVLAFVLSHISLLPHHPTLNPKHNFTAHSQQQPPSFVTISYAPECLVAFAFAGRWLDREPGNRHDDRSQSSRLYSILDSLASICVCKGKGEVYAIAIQLQEDGSAGSITLTIGGNNDVPKKYRRISEKFGNNFSRLHRAVTSFTRAMVKNTCSNTLNNLRLLMTLSLLPNPWSHSCW